MKKLLLILLFIPFIGLGQIYQKTNTDGTTTFSDEYIQGSKKLTIDDQSSDRVVVTIKNQASSHLKKLHNQLFGEDSNEVANKNSDDASDANSSTENANEETAVKYSKLEISNPTSEQSYWNQPEIGVLVNSEPTLNEGHKIQLIVDGAIFDQPKAQNKFSLPNLERGEHSVKAAIIDENGQTLIESADVTFFVHRTTVNGNKVGAFLLNHLFRS